MVSSSSLCCQICFDAIPQRDAAVTQLCGAACPAVLCTDCLVGHVSSAMQVNYVGALPRVRCPLCLVPLHKSQWSAFVRASTTTTDGTRLVLDEYARLCRQACSFQTPCCHNPTYVHLPALYNANAQTAVACKLRMSQITALQRKCRQFGRHRLAPRDLIAFITAAFPDRCAEVVHAVIARLADDERRATLLLTYHSVVDRTVVTTCCNHRTCFNCKRARNFDTHCRCEREDEQIDEASELVQCRQCRATLVKVDGCDAVQCLCGFDMDWSDELQFRRMQQQQLLPVDPFDTTAFDHWVAWHRALASLLAAVRVADHVVQMQLKRVARTYVGFVPALRRFIWRRRAATVQTELQVVLRQRLVASAIKQQRRVLTQFVHIAAVRWRQRAVVAQLKQHGFWVLYAASHADEQQALEREERAFLMQFNVCLAA